MILRASLLFVPMLAWAQGPVSPEVDQELRARVTAFYQNFLEDSFSPRKAEPYVAEDTKEFFYNAAKQKYISFTIGTITYSHDNTRAVVVVIGKLERMLASQKIVADWPQDTHWKLENGKWCWYYNPADFPVTPMGGKNPPPATASEQRAAAMVPKDGSPEAVRRAGLAVLNQQVMGLDKSQVTFSVDQASSAQLVFTNGADNEIQVALDGPVVRGLKAKLDKMMVPGHGTAVLSLEYDPADKSGGKDVWEPKGNIVFRIFASPFDRIFPISVQFIGRK
jgi:hypothetical protein